MTAVPTEDPAFYGRWILANRWANAIAWAIGMLLIFRGMDQVPWTASRSLVAPSIFGLRSLRARRGRRPWQSPRPFARKNELPEVKA
jgi:hypothetical protein